MSVFFRKLLEVTTSHYSPLSFNETISWSGRAMNEVYCRIDMYYRENSVSTRDFVNTLAYFSTPNLYWNRSINQNTKVHWLLWTWCCWVAIPARIYSYWIWAMLKCILKTAFSSIKCYDIWEIEAHKWHSISESLMVDLLAHLMFKASNIAD